MPLSNPCDAWSDLLYDKNNRGAIYQHFSDNQADLLDHLSNCQACQDKITSIDLTEIGEIGNTDPDNLESMDSAQFGKLIRLLYKAAQKEPPNFDFDDIDTSVD